MKTCMFINIVRHSGIRCHHLQPFQAKMIQREKNFGNGCCSTQCYKQFMLYEIHPYTKDKHISYLDAVAAASSFFICPSLDDDFSVPLPV